MSSNEQAIYVTTNREDPIHQGDIFISLPKPEPVFPGSFDVVRDNSSGEWVVAVQCFLHETMGMVITQDCDAIRKDSIAIAQIAPKPSDEVDKVTNSENWSKKMLEYIEGIDNSISMFYLPSSSQYSIDPFLLAWLDEIFVLPRTLLLSLRTQRICRLDDVALHYFRSKLTHHYARVPFETFYNLGPELAEERLKRLKKKGMNAEETQEYRKEWKKRYPGFPFPK